ncbi:MAG TPA: glycosyltransferase family A protein, partial [Beijerinckiaceae bacterium]|nr:glycosyltransferase family A protein [Beijerinckiaceae bacterium]
MDTVSIVIPTYNRNRSLERALASALAQQQTCGSVSLEIIVVDNSPDGNAAAIVAAHAGGPVAVRSLHEPKTGVANARNAGVAAAQGRWVAFLDDDEEASPDWIARLTETARATGADAVFGPV